MRNEDEEMLRVRAGSIACWAGGQAGGLAAGRRALSLPSASEEERRERQEAE